MTRRSPAPDAALHVRIAGAVILIAGYAALRVPTLTSGIEAALTFAGAVVCVFVIERSVSELADRRHYRAARVTSIREAVTEVIPPVHEWPDATELAIAEARHEATHALVDRGVLSEHLFTHDVLCEPTPPRGLPFAELVARLEREGAVFSARATHHSAVEHIDRDRFGNLFGSF